jgi:phage terminase large subunit
MLIPIGLDDIYRGTSAQFAGGYLNEGIEIGTLAEVESLISTLRQTVVPFNQLIIDTNPGAPGHWLNEKAEPIRPSLRKLPANREVYDRLQWEHNHRPAADPKSRWKRIVAGHEDNSGYFDLQNWEFTPMGKRYVETTLDVLTGHLRRRWLNREWTASSGTVYASFNVERHVMNPFKVPADWSTSMAYDAGVDHPTAILWFTLSTK